MKEQVKNIIHKWYRKKSIQDWILASPIRLVLPFYHVVSDNTPHHVKGLYPVRTIQEFQHDLDFFQRNYNYIIIADLLAGDDVDQPSFHLSFDDGLKESIDIIYPILEERGLKASFFVNTKFINNQDMMFRLKEALIASGNPSFKRSQSNYFNEEYLLEEAQGLGIDFHEYQSTTRPYLSTTDVIDLEQAGHFIGSHSHSHPLFYQLSEEQRMEEIKSSFSWLAEHTQQTIKGFSFPFTDYGMSNAFMQALHEEVDFSFGCAGLKEDEQNNHYQRIPMEQEGTAEEILKKSYAYYRLLKPLQRHIIRRR